eukprot:1160029-Pelagomonas_calceolata.AAC.5
MAVPFSRLLPLLLVLILIACNVHQHGAHPDRLQCASPTAAAAATAAISVAAEDAHTEYTCIAQRLAHTNPVRDMRVEAALYIVEKDLDPPVSDRQA